MEVNNYDEIRLTHKKEITSASTTHRLAPEEEDTQMEASLKTYYNVIK